MTNEEIKEENIKKALNAGIECFIQDGIEKTQILSVVTKADISKRSFLRYFGSKDNFVIEVLKDINIKCYNNGVLYYKQITEQYPLAIDRLRALFEITGKYFLEHPQVFIILSEGQSYLTHSNEMIKILNQYTLLRDYWPNTVLSLMKLGIEDGSIKCFTNEYVQSHESNAVWYAFIGLLVQLAYSNALGKYSMDDCKEIIRRFIYQTIQSLK